MSTVRQLKYYFNYFINVYHSNRQVLWLERALMQLGLFAVLHQKQALFETLLGFRSKRTMGSNRWLVISGGYQK
jgi:hypothetical protein